MIEASFGGGRTRDAAVHGAYQYDTGQRIRLHGLPSPDELAERDDFLSGDVVTVQAQFAYAGDSQTEGRLAGWDEMEGVWVASVPDAYLKRSAPVTVYVYVSYGASEESSRAKTCYEAMFTPIGRPAPSDQVTEDQLNAWDGLVTEVNLTLAGANTAISNTNAAIAGADAAAKNAQAIADKLDNLSVEAKTLSYNSAATASISDTEDGKHIAFGIPQGKPGVFTLNGKEPDENGAVVLTASDVGALTQDAAADIVLSSYPVGSIYISTALTSPASLFGGTWERLKDRFLLAAGDTYSAGQTGGEATHTLTTSEMPKHHHEALAQESTDSGTTVYPAYAGVFDGNVTSQTQGWGGLTTNTGGGAAHNNMPPYLAVYVWKRVS